MGSLSEVWATFILTTATAWYDIPVVVYTCRVHICVEFAVGEFGRRKIADGAIVAKVAHASVRVGFSCTHLYKVMKLCVRIDSLLCTHWRQQNNSWQGKREAVR